LCLSGNIIELTSNADQQSRYSAQNRGRDLLMTESAVRNGAAVIAGSLALGLVAMPAAKAQDSARMEAIERQIRTLQSELPGLRARRYRDEGRLRAVAGYEAMAMVRKGQVRRVAGRDMRAQTIFLAELFQIAA
jgi:hypothetical protein